MKLFKRQCNHDYQICQRSNVIQQDDMGYPLRLCICKCTKCEKYEQIWIDISDKELNELKTGESVLIKWL